MPKYEERKVGGGGFGDVYQLIGYNPPAVVKYLHFEANDSFQKEWSILKKLSHSNIVNYLDLCIEEEKNRIGIIMEFCERGSLEKVIFEPSIIYTMKTVIVWAKEIFDATNYMFQKHKIIHRDIKPENVFVTEDFRMKIGDFGLVKISSQPLTGTFAGTLRYMSPPDISKENTKMTDPLASHRNDVYSLGLILWETIERRLVFHEYNGDSGFDRDSLVHDIVTRKLKELASPICQSSLQDLLKRCTNFVHSLRPTASDALSSLEIILTDSSFLSTLQLWPTIEQNQKTLVKPLGFDSTKDWIHVDVESSAFNTNCSSLWKVPDGDSLGSIEKSLKEETTLSETKYDLSTFIGTQKGGYSAKLLCLVNEKFAVLSEREQRQLIATIPRIVGQMEITENYKALLQKLGSPGQYEEFYKLTPETSLEELLQHLIFHNIYWQTTRIQWGFSVLGKEIKCEAFSSFYKYRRLTWALKALEKMKESEYTVRLICNCYVSLSTGEEWLILKNDDSPRPYYFSRDFTKAIRFEKCTGKDGRQMLRKKANNESDEKRYDVYHFSHEEPIDLCKVIEGFKKYLAMLKQREVVTIRGFVADETSGQYRHVFQLRNPPRPACKHLPKCELKGYDPLSECKSSFEVLFPREMQIPIYSCASKEERLILFLYLSILDVLEDANRMGERAIPWRSFPGSNELFSISEVFPDDKAHLTFLLCLSTNDQPKKSETLRNDQPNNDETLRNNQPNSEMLRNDQPNISDMASPEKKDFARSILILLDRPDNYESWEQLPAMTFDLKLVFVDVDKVRENLKSEAFIQITPKLKARLVDRKEEPLSQWFDLKSKIKEIKLFGDSSFHGFRPFLRQFLPFPFRLFF